jgi:hypothetical protein
MQARTMSVRITGANLIRGRGQHDVGRRGLNPFGCNEGAAAPGQRKKGQLRSDSACSKRRGKRELGRSEQFDESKYTKTLDASVAATCAICGHGMCGLVTKRWLAPIVGVILRSPHEGDPAAFPGHNLEPRSQGNQAGIGCFLSGHGSSKG